jgi:hypothetical protein
VTSAALAANETLVTSIGASESIASGELLAQDSAASGEGVSESTGTGDLGAQPAVVGAGLDVTGAGSLEAQATAVAGGGRVAAIPVDVYVGPRGVESPKPRATDPIVGSGNLRAGRTRISGTGQASWKDQNELALLLLAA